MGYQFDSHTDVCLKICAASLSAYRKRHSCHIFEG